MTIRIIGLSLAAAVGVWPATPVLTRSYDNGRTGANLTETIFTPDLVGKGLKKVKSLKIPDDLRVEAQPLYVPGLVMKKDGKPHNTVLVASMGNHVFAFDADLPQGKDLLWKSSLLGNPFQPHVIQNADPGKGIRRQTDIDLFGINLKWGILSTPVIDPDAKQMYIVNWVASADKKSRALFLHRIRLEDGTEILPARPIQGVLNDAGGKPVIDARGRPVELGPDQKQRAALLLTPQTGPNKTLFIGITGGETSGDPHGWMVTFDVDTFEETGAVPTTQQGFGGGIWQGAQGPSSDDAGNVFSMTGNGGFNLKKGAGDTTPGRLGDFNGTTDFGEAFVRFHYDKTGAGKGTLTLADWFIPFLDSERKDVNNYDYQDQDLGSGAPVVPPGTNLLLGAGKDGLLYVLDRGNLGKKIGNPAIAPIYITFNGMGLPVSGAGIDFPLGGGPLQPGGSPTKTHHLHASPAYWDGSDGPSLFSWGENESLRAWKVNPGSGLVTFVAKSAQISSRGMALDSTTKGGMTGGMLSVTSNGKTAHTGIVWTLAPVDGNANTDVVPGIARAYDASTLDTALNADGSPRLKLLWESTGINFNFSKFCPPMVADGKLYVATYDGKVDVYGLR